MTRSPHPSADDVLAEIRRADVLPDRIELFRALRAAGRSDRAKAKAVDALLAPARRAFAILSDAKDGRHSDKPKGRA